MKIGIITQPLAVNYGGLLQNYALQQTLLRLDHEVYTINRNNLPRIFSAPYTARIKYYIKQQIKWLLGRPAYPLRGEYLEISKYCHSFVYDNIITTKMFRNQAELLKIVNSYDFDAYVVGSDQVWRPRYSENIYNDFLDFCQAEQGVKRIAYAASFGVSDWEFSAEQTRECKRLVQLFDAVSVREDSGITLCRDHLGVDALHVLDPTLLLDKADYIHLVEESQEPISSGELFCYILDESPAIASAIQALSAKLSLRPFEVRAPKTDYHHQRRVNISDYVVPSPTKWLRAFMDARMVFTDSFHGCVFSIIFNKPFWVIGNSERGNARFDSLLGLFGLESRRISLSDIDSIDLNTPIDWESVHARLAECRKVSMDFLSASLKLTETAAKAQQQSC